MPSVSVRSLPGPSVSRVPVCRRLHPASPWRDDADATRTALPLVQDADVHEQRRAHLRHAITQHLADGIAKLDRDNQMCDTGRSPVQPCVGSEQRHSPLVRNRLFVQPRRFFDEKIVQSCLHHCELKFRAQVQLDLKRGPRWKRLELWGEAADQSLQQPLTDGLVACVFVLLVAGWNGSSEISIQQRDNVAISYCATGMRFDLHRTIKQALQRVFCVLRRETPGMA